MQLLFATHNQNKLKEVKSLVSGNIHVLSLEDISYKKDIEETNPALIAYFNQPKLLIA